MNRLYQITVTNPCQVGWDQMAPNEQGRHCSACAKTVIDFTNYSDQEISDYLIARNGQSVCGHFKKQQVDRIRIEIPDTILTTRLARWKKFLVVCMLVFGTSIFPFETALSQIAIAGTVTEPIKKKSKKKLKKKLKPEVSLVQLSELITLDGWVSLRTTGLVSTTLPPLINLPQCIIQRPAALISEDEKSITKGSDESPKEKKPIPTSKESEFYLLPKTQRIRRSRKKKP